MNCQSDCSSSIDGSSGKTEFRQLVPLQFLQAKLQGIPFFLQEHLCESQSPLHPHFTIFSRCGGAGSMSVNLGKSMPFFNIQPQSKASIVSEPIQV